MVKSLPFQGKHYDLRRAEKSDLRSRGWLKADAARYKGVRLPDSIPPILISLACTGCCHYRAPEWKTHLSPVGMAGKAPIGVLSRL